MIRNKQAGQTAVALLIFMMLVIMLTTVAVTVIITNVRSNNAYASGQQALANAESGAENALQRLLRDPSYSGETLALEDGNATINVSRTTTKTITSQGVAGEYRRTITVTADYTNNAFTVTSWSETP